MHPAEFLIAIGGMVFTFAIVAKIFGFAKWQQAQKMEIERAKYGFEAANRQDEVSMSELQTIIEGAVQNAVSPLHDRIQSLEAKLVGKAPLSDALIEESPLEAPLKSVGRKDLA